MVVETMYDPFMGAAAGFLTLIGLTFLLVVLFLICTDKPKSKQYRELMTDMYVVGTIRKWADKDKVDLVKEIKDFAKFNKIKRIDTQALDKTIERELQERIANSTEAKISEEKEKKEPTVPPRRR